MRQQSDPDKATFNVGLNFAVYGSSETYCIFHRIQMFYVKSFSIFHRAADNVFPISVIVFYKSASELPTQAL